MDITVKKCLLPEIYITGTICIHRKYFAVQAHPQEVFHLLCFAAYCSSVLFSKENGILRFLKDAASLEEFVACKEKLLDLLSAFINILGEKIRPYALEIKVGSAILLLVENDDNR